MGYTEVSLGNGIIRRIISGSDCIEMTYTQGGGQLAPYMCYGTGSISIGAYYYVGTQSYIVGLMRISSSSFLPEGQVTQFKFICATTNCPGRTANWYLIVPENTWTAGEAGTVVTGSCCNYFAVTPTVRWKGIGTGAMTWQNGGCSIAGVDYCLDDNPPIFTGGAYSWQTSSFHPEWATRWKNGRQVNNGVVFIQTVDQSNSVSFYSIYASNAALRPRFEIDYIPYLGGTLFG